MAVRVAACAALIAPCASWITISQSKFGADPKQISAEMDGAASTDPQTTLGYIWNYPADTMSNEGLGGGIAYMYADDFCDEIQHQMREDIWIVEEFVGCLDIKAAVARSFNMWSNNHRDLKFFDVTGDCAKLGFHNASCPLSEIFVDVIDDIDGAQGTAGYGEAAATAVPIPRYSNNFRYTNGKYAEFDRGGVKARRVVIETYGAEISLSKNICWYLDSMFCAQFHLLKKQSNPELVRQAGIGVMFTIWALAMIAVLSQLGTALYKQLKMKVVIDKDGDGIEAHELVAAWTERLDAFLEVLAKESVVGTALRMLLIMVPFPFKFMVFDTCWFCYDFEAAVTHEIGHALGLGHPDQAPDELIPGYGTTAYNSYNSFLNQTGPEYEYPDKTTCGNMWQYVVEGVPTGADINPVTGIRPSLLEAFTTHNPITCITPDDLQGLNTLYPTCSMTVLEPNCTLVDLNIGYVRCVVYVLFPGFLALIISIGVHTLVDRYEDKKMRQQQVANKWLRGTLGVAKASTSTAAGGGGLANVAAQVNRA